MPACVWVGHCGLCLCVGVLAFMSVCVGGWVGGFVLVWAQGFHSCVVVCVCVCLRVLYSLELDCYFMCLHPFQAFDPGLSQAQAHIF